MDAQKLVKLRKQAEKAVGKMPDSDMKLKAFEVILGHLLGGSAERVEGSRGRAAPARQGSSRKTRKAEESKGATPDLAKIVNLVKDCDESEAIGKEILDRTSQVDRTLLPLYVVHEYMGNAFDLTSGHISKVTGDLGIRISQPAASRTLAATASRYVMGDKVKKKGLAVRYKLTRRGVKYMKQVLKGSGGE